MNTISLTSEAQLRNFKQISVEIDAEHGVAWIYQHPTPRPCYNQTLVEELRALQILLETKGGYLPHKGENVRIQYLVLDSTIEGVFSMGGDLGFFKDCVVNQNKEELHKYADLCINTIYSFVVGCRQKITTISLVRGDALGGGFEVALSCNVIIAEEQARMGFPEILFNIFPGMGGYHLLSKRLPTKQVENMMINGQKHSAEELYQLGVVDRLEESGKGREGVYKFIRECNKHRKGYLAISHISDKINKLSQQDLLDISNYWVDVTMEISDHDLKLIEKLVHLQDRMMAKQHADNGALRSIA